MRFLVSISALLLVVGSVPARAATISPSAIHRTLALYVKAHPYAMVAMGVIDRGRKMTYFIRGSQVKARLDDRTQFQIGSITKVFTATVLTQMVIAKQMKLSDPIQRYLPAGVTAPSYRGTSITLVSLATHTSGLPFVPPNLGSLRSPQMYTERMLGDALATTKLTRAPGSR